MKYSLFSPLSTLISLKRSSLMSSIAISARLMASPRQWPFLLTINPPKNDIDHYSILINHHPHQPILPLPLHPLALLTLTLSKKLLWFASPSSSFLYAPCASGPFCSSFWKALLLFWPFLPTYRKANFLCSPTLQEYSLYILSPPSSQHENE